MKLGPWPYMKSIVLRRIFGPQREEVTGQWTPLWDEELNN
jgi:hypothetical protein